jgi:hypothetical protein
LISPPINWLEMLPLSSYCIIATYFLTSISHIKWTLEVRTVFQSWMRVWNIPGNNTWYCGKNPPEIQSPSCLRQNAIQYHCYLYWPSFAHKRKYLVFLTISFDIVSAKPSMSFALFSWWHQLFNVQDTVCPIQTFLFPAMYICPLCDTKCRFAYFRKRDIWTLWK